MRSFFSFVVIVSVFLSCSSPQKDAITEQKEIIPDQNLAAAVRFALKLYPNEPISEENLKVLKKLDASQRGIKDLTGLEKMTSLTSLDLAINEIKDVTRLSGLTQLKVLKLYNNQISDVSPLSGLTQLTLLWLMAYGLWQIKSATLHLFLI